MTPGPAPRHALNRAAALLAMLVAGVAAPALWRWLTQD